ncbi:MAG TPA: hypothetical protein VG270_02140 [Pseudolabrys sp.]|nr:hypothetical protein [Pseudolabrys sp.]
MPNTLVLIHGYSDEGKSFATWREKLKDDYEKTEQICICDYVSLTNEVTIKDLAEGFDLALKLRAGLSNDEPFDAIVHSTGMLVLRTWLTSYASRRNRLKHLIGIAPATFGSPLAQKGRSWIGAVFKGNRHLGPDFMAAGDRILDGLELASPYTWNLAQKDLFGSTTYYDTQDARLTCTSSAGPTLTTGFARWSRRPERTVPFGKPAPDSMCARSLSI